MNSARILFFADGSRNLGSGHAVRSLVLAKELMGIGYEALVAGTNVTLIKGKVASLSEIPTRDCDVASEVRERKVIADQFEPMLSIVDGYEFDVDFFAWLQSCSSPHGVIDDFGRTRSTSPLFILDQNPGSNLYDYRGRFPRTTLLLGNEFFLIRREFLEAFERKQAKRGFPYVMVSFGGTDILGLGLEVSLALADAGFKVKIANGHRGLSSQASERVLRHHSNISIVNQSDYESTLAGASCAVLAAGTSIWESLMLGIPTIGVIVADNQVRGARFEAQQNPLLSLVDARACNELAEILPTLVGSNFGKQKLLLAPSSKSPRFHSARHAAERISSIISAKV